MSDYRVCNTEDLRLLVKVAKRNGFNRIPILPDLDPDGGHVVSIVLFGHNMDQSSVFHHRCRVLCKVLDEDNPVEIMLDVRDEDFRRLHKADKFKASA